VNELLVQKTIELVSAALKDRPDDIITELYAGAGNFTFALAEKLPKNRIEAVELNHQLTSAAAEIIKAKKMIKQVTFFTTKSETFANNRIMSSDLILLDPPRSGCHSDVIHRISEVKPKHLVYISCHPTMLARDLSLFIKKSPDYKIQHLQIFDMFPQTDHFETLCVLERI
jgi:23S rRNA (uracil1939-C5)-methyltransferase